MYYIVYRVREFLSTSTDARVVNVCDIDAHVAHALGCMHVHVERLYSSELALKHAHAHAIEHISAAASVHMYARACMHMRMPDFVIYRYRSPDPIKIELNY